MDVDIYSYFIDYHKAFDSVQCDKLIEILKSIGINDDRDLRIITNLYWNQLADIKLQRSSADKAGSAAGLHPLSIVI